MNQEVAKNEKGGVPMAQTMAPQEIISTDIIIPRLLLMQGLSEAVAARKAQQGDMIRSTTGEVLGGPEKPVEIIPLKLTQGWRLEEKIGGKFEFRRREPRNAANDGLPWEFQEGGAQWRRLKTLGLFALLEQDVTGFLSEMAKDGDEMPDVSKSLLPVMLEFRSTSFFAGKTIATFYAQVRDMLQYNPKVKAYAYKLSLSCKQTTNDKGTFYVFQVDGKPKKIAADLLPQAERWFGYVNRMGDIKVDSAEDETDEVTPASQF